MKLSKSQGISFFASIILFAAFSVVVFLLKVPHGVMFWLGYLFAIFAIIVLCASLFFFFTKKVKEEKVLNVPVVFATWIYFAAQMYFSGWEIISFPYDYIPALIINLALGLVASIIILSLSAYAERVDKSEQRVSEKVLFIKMLKYKVDGIETDNDKLKEKLSKLSEEIRFSDPMSHSKLNEVEAKITQFVDGLVENIGHEKAPLIIDEISKLLKTRNTLCKTLKGVKDTASEKKEDSKGGNKVAIAGVGVAFAVIMITLAVCFVIVPGSKYKKANELLADEKYEDALNVFADLNGYKDSDEKITEIENTIKYNEASKLMEAHNYEGAIQVFSDLGDFSDSSERIEEIETLINNEKYDAAVKLVEEKKYDEATQLFRELGEFSDSADRIEQIETLIKDEAFDAVIKLVDEKQYEEAIAALGEFGSYRDADKIKVTVTDEWYDVAEEYFNNGEYEEALEIYNKLNPYRDSIKRIEAINNRQAGDDIFYFGLYDGEAIAWRIIEQKNGMIRLMAEQIIKTLPITDDISVTDFENSSLSEWLNNDFLSDFGKENIGKIVLSDGNRVNLLTQEEVTKLIEDGVNLSADSEWWISTECENGFMFVGANGKLNEEGDLGIREKGVRPVIWISAD